jgi:hypothetical protein
VGGGGGREGAREEGVGGLEGGGDREIVRKRDREREKGERVIAEGISRKRL